MDLILLGFLDYNSQVIKNICTCKCLKNNPFVLKPWFFSIRIIFPERKLKLIGPII